MVTLDIELNCMCLLVPDPAKGAMRVLMPCTHDQAPTDRHVAVLRYQNANGKQEDRGLEGWALELGDSKNAGASQDLTLANGDTDGTVVKLLDLNGNPLRVPRRLWSLKSTGHRPVISMITFYGGYLSAVEAEDERWVFNGTTVAIANQVTWRITIAPEQIKWTPLHAGATQAEPLVSLEDIAPSNMDGTEVKALQVYHVTQEVLMAKTPAKFPQFSTSLLTPDEIRVHFGMFYRLLGVKDPRLQRLPVLPKDPQTGHDPDPPGGSPGWACLLAMAEAA